MAITCPRCGSEYDATLFQFGHRVRCVCGQEIEYPGTDLRAGHVFSQEGVVATAPASVRESDDESAARSWEVWRQGDDGNAFSVRDGLTAKEADDLVAVYESRGHKQLYWKSRAKGN
jgi:hypothetical protein